MQNSDFNQKPKTRSTKKIAITILLILGLILINIAVVYLFIGRNNDKPQIVQVEQNQIIESDLLDTKNISSNGVKFEIPGGYVGEELNNGIYSIKNANNIDESAIIVDTTNAKDANINFDKFVLDESNSLKSKVEKELTNGIKMFGVLDTTPKLFAFLKTAKGIVVLTSSGDQINEAIFDAITASVEEN